MAIDSGTLQSWAKYNNGPIKSAKRTHTRIQNELQTNDRLSNIDFNTFLQGSYANSTIVRASSDVDIVVRLKEMYYADLSGLDEYERDEWRRSSGDPGYSWQKFRSDVVDVLEERFGASAVDPLGKAIEVDTSKLPLNADVLVCANHRAYYNYPNGSVEILCVQHYLR